MENTKQIGEMIVIVQTDKSYLKRGEVQFAFHEKFLKEHIRDFGHKELLEGLSYMNFQVWTALREVNREDDKENKNIAKPQNKK